MEKIINININVNDDDSILEGLRQLADHVLPDEHEVPEEVEEKHLDLMTRFSMFVIENSQYLDEEMTIELAGIGRDIASLFVKEDTNEDN